jgi:hypothetical protein
MSVIGFTAIELLKHLLDTYVQPEDVADQITLLHKDLEQKYDPAAQRIHKCTIKQYKMLDWP